MGLDLLLDAAAAGVALCAAMTLAPNARGSKAFLALFGFFVVVAVCFSLTALASTSPAIRAAAPPIAFAALLSMAPLLWIYARSIASLTRPRWAATDFLHAGPSALSLLIGAAYFALPTDQRAAFSSDAAVAPGWARTVAYGFEILKWMLLIQVTAYVASISWLLHKTSRNAKLHFANLKDKTLRWLPNLTALGLLGFVTLFVAVTLNNKIIDDSIFSAWDLFLLSAFAFWGVNQRPIFHDELEISTEPLPSSHSEKKKYRNSNLDKSKQKEISSKLLKAMQDNSIFLDPMLSLSKLARHIGETPNNVSQTLNSYENKNFYDYVSTFRIEEAKKRLRNSNESVSQITYEVGYNSRSSFYSAFKEITGDSPGEYRKRHRSPENGESRGVTPSLP